MEQMEAILLGILSPQADVRNNATQAFEAARGQPDAFVQALLAVVAGSNNNDARRTASVFLRTQVCSAGFWAQLSGVLCAQLKNTLLQLLAREGVADIRMKLCDTISEAAQMLFTAEEGDPQVGAWPELLPGAVQLAQAEGAGQREAGIILLTRLAYPLKAILAPQKQALAQICTSGLRDSELKVQVAALAAVISLVEVVFCDDQSKAQFQQLLPLMLPVLSNCLSARRETELRSSIALYIELAECDPLFMRPVVPQLCSFMAQLAMNTNAEDATRQFAVEFLVTLCESKPGMVRKVNSLVDTIVKICMAFLMEVEHDDDWFEETEADPDMSNADVGSESLDRLCLALSGMVMVPLFSAVLPGMLKHEDWRQRFVGLQMVCIMGEGCKDELWDQLEELVQLVLPAFQDGHPRVRYAACNTLGQMCADYGPLLQQEFHAALLPRLLQVLAADNEYAKVRAHACASIVNWCDQIEPSTLDPYIKHILGALAKVIGGGQIMAQEEALVALAAVAECLEDGFADYYDMFMPGLQKIFFEAEGAKFKKLRGKAVDAITVIASSVGPQKFHPDAARILPFMVRLHNAKNIQEDALWPHLMLGWARICKCLKAEFVPYLKVVMPPTLEVAGMMPEMTTANTDTYEGLLEEGDWDFVQLSSKNIAIRTSHLEEKATAVNMLFCYSSDLGRHFMPYVVQSANILVPLLQFYFDEKVRTAASATLPKVVLCMKDHVANGGGQRDMLVSMWKAVLPQMLEAISSEYELDPWGAKLAGLAECLESLGPNCVDGKETQQIMEQYLLVLQRVLKRKRKLAARSEEQDFDEVERYQVEVLLVKTDEVLSALADLHCAIIKVAPGPYMKLVSTLQVKKETLSSVIGRMINQPITPTDAQIGICQLDDIVEFGGDAAVSLYPNILPVLSKGIGHTLPEIRQAAAYGLGVYFEKAPAAKLNADHVNGVVRELLKMVDAPKSRAKKNSDATENAISAIGKALQFRSSLLREAQGVWQKFLSYLPVRTDEIEARVTYGTFVNIVMQQSALAFGQNFQHAPKILSILATIVNTKKYITEETNKNIMQLLQVMSTQIPAPAWQQALNALEPALKQRLSNAANKSPHK